VRIPGSSSIRTALGAAGAVLLLFGGWKGCNAYDDWQKGRREAKVVSADIHAKKAETFHAAGDSIRRSTAPAVSTWKTLIGSPAVRASPIAVQVAAQGELVIAGKDAEIAAVRSEAAERTGEAADLRSIGKDRGPRAIPYADALYSFRSQEKPEVTLRAGIDYRVLPHAMVKLEIEHRGEFRLNVGIHATFR
jgi:hypothetical protein